MGRADPSRDNLFPILTISFQSPPSPIKLKSEWVCSLLKQPPGPSGFLQNATWAGAKKDGCFHTPCRYESIIKYRAFKAAYRKAKNINQGVILSCPL